MVLRTLNVHCPWTEVLQQIERPAKRHVLPARVRCPLCDGAKLTIYEDTILGGAWHYCFDCRSCGDMIELAAATWNVSPQVAVRRLSAKGCPVPRDGLTAESVNAYAEFFVKKRKRTDVFQQNTSRYFLTREDGLLTALRDKFRIASQLNQQRWRDSMGYMLGAYPAIDVERFFAPHCEHQIVATSAARVFKGRGWSTVILVPNHDLPGRICGFTIVGRNAKREDFIFRHITMKQHSSAAKIEGGFGCYWAVENSYGMFENNIVVTGDPFLALRLHVRHFAAARTALPLISYVDIGRGLTQNAWSMFDRKVMILWGWRVTPSLVYQAIQSDGKLAITELADTSQFRIDHFVRNAEPRTIIKRVVEAALPWREYLRRWADRVEDGVIEDLVLGLETYGVDLKVLSEVGGRFAKLVKPYESGNSVQFGTYTISESDGKTWFCWKNSSAALLMNCLLRVDGTRTEKKNGHQRVFYCCRVIIEGVEVPFEVPIEPGLKQKRVMERAVARKLPHANLVIAPSWDTRLINMARYMKEHVTPKQQ